MDQQQAESGSVANVGFIDPDTPFGSGPQETDMRTIIMTSALLAAGLATPALADGPDSRCASNADGRTVAASEVSQGARRPRLPRGPDQGRARLLRGAGRERQRLPDQGGLHPGHGRARYCAASLNRNARKPVERRNRRSSHGHEQIPRRRHGRARPDGGARRGCIRGRSRTGTGHPPWS